MNKKNILLSGFLGTVIFCILKYFDHGFWPQDCAYSNPPILDCGKEFIYYLSVVFTPLFFFSLATYRMKEGIFLSWKKFTLIYLFIYLFIVLVSPWIGGDYLTFEKELVSKFLTEIYFLISLILIVYKSIKLRKS
jgi:hypothetical protein